MIRKFYIFLGVIVVTCLVLIVYILVSTQKFTFKELKTLDNVKQIEIFLSLKKTGLIPGMEILYSLIIRTKFVKSLT